MGSRRARQEKDEERNGKVRERGGGTGNIGGEEVGCRRLNGEPQGHHQWCPKGSQFNPLQQSLLAGTPFTFSSVEIPNKSLAFALYWHQF